MKDIKKMTTLELFSYADLSNASIDTMMKAGTHLMNMQSIQAIDFGDGTKLTTNLQKNINEYNKVRQDLHKEISVRFKANFGVFKSPEEVHKMLLVMSKEHPVLNREFKDVKAEKDREKAEQLIKDKKERKVVKEVKTMPLKDSIKEVSKQVKPKKSVSSRAK